MANNKLQQNTNEKIVFLEKLNLMSLFYILYLNYKNKINKVFYIHENSFSKIIINLTRKFFRIKVSKLEFSLMSIKENNELIRFRIDRLDLFEFRDYLNNNIDVQENSKFKNFKKFIVKGMCGYLILDHNSPGHLLYLIEVVKWFSIKKNFKSDIIFISLRRPFFSFYKKKALKLNI